MPRETKVLTVRVLDQPRLRIREISEWTETNFSPRQAEEYVAYLRNELASLAARHVHGKPVPGHPRLRYLSLKRQGDVHGHFVFFRVMPDSVEVTHIFHTAEDWPRKLR
jgi:plasmid stabilization system protein ParE